MRVIYFFFFSITLLLGCKPASNSDSTSTDNLDANAIEAQVLAIHDEVMPKLSDINTLSGQLRDIRSNLKETPEGKIVAPEGLDPAIEALKLAEQGMFDWMKSYSDTKPTLTPDQLKPYLQNQLEIIKNVKENVLSSIQRAQTWLAANPPK
jgi:hypothetical protein